MEQNYEFAQVQAQAQAQAQLRAARKGLRRQFSATGWALLIYYGIMNVAVSLVMIVEIIVRLIDFAAMGDLSDIDAMMDTILAAAESAWGYFLAAGVGLLILLIWKKPRYWKEEIWKKGKPMTAGSFFAILCIFMSGQFVHQVVTVGLEAVLNSFGLSMLEGMESLSIDTDNFGMFLYAGILAPITEEILFRGLIQRSLMPYGKKFAIFCSAFTFGLFHGNLIQTPFAFVVGLVLGYVAMEYSIAWAMVLHMFNNLVIGDMLGRLTMGLPEELSALITWLVIIAFAVAALVIVIVKRRQIGDYLRQERMNREYVKCFLSCAGIIVFMALMGANILLTTFILILPM